MTAQLITYRGWRIDYEQKPIPDRSYDWGYQHPDFDGPEDNRHGYAPTLAAAKEAIDEFEDDR